MLVRAKKDDAIPKGWQLMNLNMLEKYGSLNPEVIGSKGVAIMQEAWKFYVSDSNYFASKGKQVSKSSMVRFEDQLLIREQGIVVNLVNSRPLKCSLFNDNDLLLLQRKKRYRGE